MLKDNKLASTLLLATVLLGGALVFFGCKKRSEYQEQVSSYQNASGTLRQLESSTPFPTAENVAATEQAGIQFKGKAEALGKALLAYRPAEIQNIQPVEFSDLLRKSVARVVNEFKSAGVQYPEEFHLGFEGYTERAPREDATGILSYQLAATTDLFTKFAKSGATSLNNIYRAPIPPETGQPFRTPPRNPRNAAFTPYETLPMEISFTGKEASVRKVLSTLNNDKEYFFVIRSMRVRNENQAAPKREDAVFVEAAPAIAPNNAFGLGGFAFPGDDEEEEPAEVVAPPAPAPPVDYESNIILKPVLGEEKLHVFLSLDLILFNEPPAEK